MAPYVKPTDPQPPRQPFQAHFLLCSLQRLYDLSICLNAQTLLAHDVDHDENLVITLPCKQWDCRFCAARKIAMLSRRTALANPNRLLTLTIDPSRYESPRHGFDETRRQVPVLISNLRKRFEEVEYLRVTELHKSGWPHYHLMVRSPYLPHSVVRDAWKALTGATIVDLRQVTKAFKAYYYLVKYLSKLHRIEWTDRHVSFSRGFFPPDRADPQLKRSLVSKTIIPQHPYNYLEEHYHGKWIAQTTPGTFRVDLDPDFVPARSSTNLPPVYARVCTASTPAGVF